MLGSLLAVYAPAVAAQGGQAASPEGLARLARDSGCLVCHAVERKVIGPALRDVAARYAGQADAPLRLGAAVLHGSTGRWGSQPMPPNAGVSAEDAERLAGWVLGLKP